MSNLTKIASLPGSGSGCMAALPAEVARSTDVDLPDLKKSAPQAAAGRAAITRHYYDDGRGARDVYVDGVKLPMVIEADTAEGWAIIMRKAGPGEFAPSGVQETRRGKVEVFPAGTGRHADLLDTSETGL